MAMELRNRVVPVFELAVELFGDLHPSDKGFLEAWLRMKPRIGDGRGAAVHTLATMPLIPSDLHGIPMLKSDDRTELFMTRTDLARATEPSSS